MKENKIEKNNLFMIGEMEKLFNISVRTLRYYDQVGLLKPEYIDETTHYRYYSINQFERLNTIKYFRKLDMPIEEISKFFQEKDVETLLIILNSQKEEVKQRQVELAKIERKINTRINQLNSAIEAPYGEMIFKTLAQREIFLLKKTFSLDDNIEPLIRSLSKEHHLDESIFLGKVGLSIARKDLKHHIFTSFSSLFIVVEDEDGFEKTERHLPAGKYLTVKFLGTHRQAAVYYKQCLEYIELSGYQIAGDSIEITMIDEGITDNDDKFVTELQIPCK